MFRFASKVTKSDAEFTPAEFDEMAKEAEHLVKQVPGIGIAFRALGPLAIAGEAIDKVQRLQAGVQARKQRDEAQQASENLYGPYRETNH